MALRIRFRITERADLYYSPMAKRLTFTALADAGIAEDDRFSQGAPAITFSAVCDVSAALDALGIGGEFYFDISAVPE